ncbi:hypothetical protein HDU98_004458, partial [Podochytrium sp. JEL0797]
RRFREKKQLYIEGLERENAELKRRLAELETSQSIATPLEGPSTASTDHTTISNSWDKFNHIVMQEKLTLMESRISSLELENTALRAGTVPSLLSTPDPSGLYGTNPMGSLLMDFGFTDDWLELMNVTPPAVVTDSVSETCKSAEEVYGPVEVESSKISFKGLRSLRHLNLPEQLMGLIQQQSRTVATEELVKLQVQLSTVGQTLLNSCSMVDRQRCIEISAVFFERNKHQMAYIYQLTNRGNETKAIPKPPLATTLPPDALRFCATVKKIPSLSNPEAHALVDEFCGLFWNDAHMPKETLFHMNQLNHAFHKLLVGAEDIQKWIVAFECVRVSDKMRVDALMEEGMKSWAII